MQLSARNYLDYATALARAGYTVVQYDIEQGAGPLQVVPDAVEVTPPLHCESAPRL